MISVALKMIRNNKTRFVLTVLGFVVTVLILLVGLFYFRLSKNVIEDSVNTAISQRQLLVNQVEFPLVEYFAVGEEMIPNYVKVDDSELKALFSEEGVSSICVQYMILDNITVSAGEYDIRLLENVAIDVRFDCFSEALENQLRKSQKGFSPLLAGRTFSKTDPYEVLLNEVFVKAMKWSPEEAIGKQLSFSVPGAGEYVLTVVGVYSHKMSSWSNTDFSSIDEWLMGVDEESREIDDSILFSSLFFEKMAEKVEKPEYAMPSRIICTMKNTSYIEPFIKQISNRYQWNSLSDYMDFYNQLEKQTEFTSVFIIVGVFLSVLVLIMVVNTIAVNIHQQKRFLSLMSLLGYNRRDICRFYALQSLAYGGIGSTIGAVLGFVITTFFGLKAYASLSEYGLESSSLLLPFQYLLLIIVAFSILCLVLGYFAAWIKMYRRSSHE